MPKMFSISTRSLTPRCGFHVASLARLALSSCDSTTPNHPLICCPLFAPSLPLPPRQACIHAHMHTWDDPLLRMRRSHSRSPCTNAYYLFEGSIISSRRKCPHTQGALSRSGDEGDCHLAHPANPGGHGVRRGVCRDSRTPQRAWSGGAHSRGAAEAAALPRCHRGPIIPICAEGTLQGLFPRP